MYIILSKMTNNVIFNFTKCNNLLYSRASIKDIKLKLDLLCDYLLN